MPGNPILTEIHRHRETVARGCGYDAAKLMAYYRKREAERSDDHPLVDLSPRESGASCAVREEPPIPSNLPPTSP